MNEIKCTKCNTIKETGNVEYEAIDMGLAIHCTICGCAQPHERATESANETLKILNEHVELHHDGPVMYPTGCEECVIGTFYDADNDVDRAVISIERLVEHFSKEFEEEEDSITAAYEWIDFNVYRGAEYQGPGKPLFIHEVGRD
jgi:hypothetical protein